MGYLEYFRLFLLILSLVGIFIFVRHRFKIPVELIPVTVFSSIGLLVFFSGILNIMKILCFIIFIFGFYGYRYLKCVSTDKRFWISNSIFLVVCSFLFIFLKDLLFIHYDNFSHWGLVAREILVTNSFPNFKTPIITFQSYITGSASFIYYVCKIIGTRQEGVMLFAQGLLNISVIHSIFVFINKKKLVLILPIIIFGLYLITSNILPYDLPVDTLLSSYGIALTVILMKYKNDIGKGIVIFSIIASYLITIKSSGLFFVIANLFLMYSIVKGISKLKVLKYQLYVLACTLGINYVWKAHVEYVYLSGNNSKHAVSFSSYKSNLLDKGKTKIFEIIHTFLNKVFSLEDLIWYIIGMIILLVVIGYFIGVRNKHLRFTLVIKLVLIYFFYQISLLLMYIFSMPYNEAKNLDSYNRYYLTIIVYIIGVLIVYIITMDINTNAKFLMMIILLSYPSVHNYLNVKEGFLNYKNNVRLQIHKELIRTNMDSSQKINISPSKVSEGYLWYVLRYELHDENFDMKKIVM